MYPDRTVFKPRRTSTSYALHVQKTRDGKKSARKKGVGFIHLYILDSHANQMYECANPAPFLGTAARPSTRRQRRPGPTPRFATSPRATPAHARAGGIGWAASTDQNYSPGAFNNPYGSGVYEPWVLDFSFTLSSNTEVNYLFADGFETGDLRFWSSSQL